MSPRLLSFLTVLVSAWTPAAARPDEAKAAAQPTLVIRLASIDRLVDDAKYLATAAGHAEQAKQFDAFIKSQIGDKGLAGVDTKRPLGIYSVLSPDFVSSAAVVVAPISDEKEFLGLLDNLNQKVEKDGDLYSTTVTVGPLPITVFFRFANQYLYATAHTNADLAKEALAKEKLLAPAKALSSGGGATISAVFRLEQIPKELKHLALQEMELRLVHEKEDVKVPGETEAQKKFRGQVLDAIAARTAAVIKEGGELAFRFDVDREAAKLTAEVSLSAKPGSKLAESIAELSRAKSLFSATPAADAALTILAHLSMPEDLRHALEPVIDEGIHKALEHTRDDAKRRQAEKILKALEPSLKAGELDVAFGLRGPTADKLYTFVAGIKLKDGKTVETALRDLVRTLPERDRDKIKFDVDRAGKAKIHRIDAGKDFDPKARAVLGRNPIYVAVRADAVLIGAGPEGLKAMKQWLAAEPKAGPQFETRISVLHLADIIANDAAAKGHKDAPEMVQKIAREAFGNRSQPDDQISLLVEGGKTLKVRLAMSADVLAFFDKLRESGLNRARREAERARDEAIKARQKAGED